MKPLWFLFLFLGTSHAFLGINFGKLFGWFESAKTTYDKYKLEALQQWNSANFASVFGNKLLQTAIEYNPNFRVGTRDVKFYLYTKQNPTDAVEIWEDSQVLTKTYFDVKAPVKIICHGFLSSYKSGPGQTIAPMYLQHMYDVNVIVIDWSSLSGIFTKGSSLKDLKNDIYFPPAKYTESVGRFTASLVDFLVGQGTSLKNIHLIGHSLGAHAMGWAGRSVQVGKIPRITALDPAAPCFENNLASTCIEGNYVPIGTSDADFVDAIHTHGRFYGYTLPIGHVDFYPNGGMTQPGCKYLQFGTCSHSRSIDLYAETISPSSRLIGQKCSSWEDYEKQKCNSYEYAKMGEFCPWTSRGTYFLSTKDKPPFAV
ncbi:unnamed protein product [Allacma fusca]|uniref:Lipase domain-containing protein n=1 Tax=Allacma fusca TaxID=39272 RepID=A0A8J2NLZ7_9HEXA|nr:unnamed protein product [Allacma fusca]